MSTGPAYQGMTVESVGDVAVVRFTLAEIVDEKTANQIGQQLFDLVEEKGCRRLVLNFSRVRIMVSTMLSKVLGLRRRMNALGGRVVLCEPNPELSEVLDALRLAQLFGIYDQEARAVASF
jgi:anti-sigma B factor antagonist